MKILGWVAGIIKRRPWTVIIVCVAATLALGFGLPMLKGQVTYESILPKGFPSIRALHTLREKFNGISYESVLITAPDITDPRIVQFMVGLEDYINKDPELNQGQVVMQPGEKVSFREGGVWQVRS